jgi:hypothetical protein
LYLRRFIIGALFGLLVAAAFAGDIKPPKLSEQNRRDLIRVFTAESAFALRFVPMGKIGLKIEDGRVLPGEAEVRQLVADHGPACRPGDRVEITNLRFTGREIVFEINGGPLSRKKWWQRVEAGSGGTVAPGSPRGSNPEDVYNRARGSYVMLAFKDYVPELNAGQVKEMLAPVLDFKAESGAEAYLKSLPPKLQQAVKEHRALVGMDHEMVTCAKGRPGRRIRERDGATEYEEWIYGEPPSEVEFVRFVDDKVIRIETMKVDGAKIVRTQPEADLANEISAAVHKAAKGEEAAGSRPSLLRPGETAPQVDRQSPDVRPASANWPAPGQAGGEPTGIPDASSPMPGRMPTPGAADPSGSWPPK